MKKKTLKYTPTSLEYNDGFWRVKYAWHHVLETKSEFLAKAVATTIILCDRIKHDLFSKKDQ